MMAGAIHRRAGAVLVVLVGAIAVSGYDHLAGATGTIPDEGLPAVSVEASPLVSERTEVLAAGVVGRNELDDSFPDTDAHVLAFAEHDGVIYVGGKFTRVLEFGIGVPRQPFLAAFDRDTGAWIDTFRPALDGNVWDLKVTPDGDLLVAGQFAAVDGEPGTAALARIDLATGQVDPHWRVDVRLTGSAERALVRTLDIEGDDVYLGGNFTRVTGPDGAEKPVGRIARVDLATGNVDGAFLPDIDGIVFDIDADGDRVYAVGNFLYTDGTWTIGLSVTQAADGRLVPGLTPWVRTYLANTRNSYQQAVLALGDEVWQAGAQHTIQAYRASDYALVRSFVSDPWGDGQALAYNDGILYGGTHANGDTYMYSDATAWPELIGWTSRLPVRWIGAFDVANHAFLDWYPGVGSGGGEGAWELFIDSTDCLWAGGDINRGSYDGSVPRQAAGFAKFCPNDTNPPAPPTNPAATLRGDGGVNLSWEPSPGDDRGDVRYEILKNDRVLASHISITTFADRDGVIGDRYFVRAMDTAGNRSATTPVFEARDTIRPTVPQHLASELDADGNVVLSWTASTDNVGVVSYRILHNGTEIEGAAPRAPGYVVPAPEPGSHWYQVRARDAAGNQSWKTPSVRVDIAAPDVQPPSTPRNLVGVVEASGDVTLTWDASTDDVGVVEYQVLRNRVEIAVVASPGYVVPAPDPGSHWYQVRARDAAGNEGDKTAPTRIDIG